jgi:nucleotide-binding universal stress UspA family protein
MSKTYLVAVDGSDHGSKALDLAINLAKASDAALTILHVVPYEPMPEGLRQYADMEGIKADEMNARFHYGKALGDRITEEAEERAHMAGLGGVTTEVAEGHPASEIVAVARAKGAEMLFIGSRGLSDVGGMLLGSVSHKVMHLAPCTCVAVK